MIDIIMPVLNKKEMTSRCLESIGSASDIPFRLIIVDNASSVETKEFLADFAGRNRDVALVCNETNVGWVKAVNQGMKMSSAPYICVMNNDTIVRTKGWLSGLIEVASSSADIGLVNPHFDSKRDSHSTGDLIEIDFCRGYCVLIKAAVMQRIGFLDESYGMGYYDDDDYSVRAIRAGFRCVRANHVFVEHLRDTTFISVMGEPARRTLHEANKELFYSKWGRRLNVVFIFTGSSDAEKTCRILLALARRQHIVHLWNLTASPLEVAHINVRETHLVRLFSRQQMNFRIRHNMMKSPEKRYRMIFADGASACAGLAKLTGVVRCVGPSDAIDDVVAMADSESRKRV